MKKPITLVGLDTHKNSIEVALADEGANSEVRLYGSIGGDLDSLDKMIRKLRIPGAELRFVYEAGPCGYEIYRHLRAQDLHCDVVAPSMVPRRSGDRIKNDRRDASFGGSPSKPCAGWPPWWRRPSWWRSAPWGALKTPGN